MSEKLTKLRFARRDDCAVILGFIKELAAYEKMSEQVVATEALLEEWLFDKKKAEVILLYEYEQDNTLQDATLDAGIHEQAVGFALYFYNFSTFLGRAGIYLEDLYVRPAYRGKGYGKQLLTSLARIAVDKGCGRLEWSCLDWNQPSIDFYLSLGATPMEDWTQYRLSGKTLEKRAEEASSF